MNVCFQKRDKQENTFNFELNSLIGQFTGKTFLMDQANPQEQHFFIQDKKWPSLKIELQAHLSEKELQSIERFCTKATPAQQSN